MPAHLKITFTAFEAEQVRRVLRCYEAHDENTKAELRAIQRAEQKITDAQDRKAAREIGPAEYGTRAFQAARELYACPKCKGKGRDVPGPNNQNFGCPGCGLTTRGVA